MVWVKGQSGNPGGRIKRHPITDALKAELKKHAASGKGTNLQALALRLVELAIEGDVPAAKLILAYVEGQPVQPVEFLIREKAEQLAKVVGCTADELIADAEAIVAQAGRRG